MISLPMIWSPALFEVPLLLETVCNFTEMSICVRIPVITSSSSALEADFVANQTYY